MRTKLVIAATAGALTLSGLAVAVPALADGGSPAGSAVERITGALSGLVSDGSITQEQADEVAGTLSEAGIGVRGDGPEGAGPWGPGGRGGLELDAAATALGMSEDALRTALEADGTTLADVADDHGVPIETLVDALVASGKERIAAAVEDGRITQEQADERLADLEQRITERVESAMPAGGAHGPRGHRGSAADGPAETPAD
jgi:polyhydroxyalkanoate synthesis regulator phasin